MWKGREGNVSVLTRRWTERDQPNNQHCHHQNLYIICENPSWTMIQWLVDGLVVWKDRKLMSQSVNNTASAARWFRTSKVAVKGCAAAPGRLMRWTACSTFDSDKAVLYWPSIEYQGCAELRVIWYSRRGELGNEIDVVRGKSRWLRCKKEGTGGGKAA